MRKMRVYLEVDDRVGGISAAPSPGVLRKMVSNFLIQVCGEERVLARHR
jgi:hypothetical protein